MHKLSKFLPVLLSAVAVLIAVVLISKHNLIDQNRTKAIVKSNVLISSLLLNEKASNQKYEGKVIEITGKVDTISFLNETNTVILYGDKNSGIICDFSDNQTKEIKALKKHDIVTIKRVYRGFLNDAILLNCTLLNPKNDE